MSLAIWDWVIVVVLGFFDWTSSQICFSNTVVCSNRILSFPADGTVAPPELTVSVLPVGSSSDRACKSLPSVSVDTLSPIKGEFRV